MTDKQPIPEDILAEAKRVEAAIPYLFSDFEANLIVDAVARATLAERERCAKLIDCGCERDHCPFPGNCSKDDVDDIMHRP